MRRFQPVIITCLLLMFCLPSHQIDAQEICKDLTDIIKLEQQFNNEIISFRANPLTANYDLKYHRIEWQVDPTVHYISGTVTSYFTPTTEGFTQLNFDLSVDLQVNAVLYHGDTMAFVQTNNDNLQINLPDSIPNGTLDSVTVNYEGAPVVNGFGSFKVGAHGQGPALWTLSEPYGAKTWWPCKQDLSDKIDSIDVIVQCPSEYKVASNGVLLATLDNGTNTTFHWRHRYPIPAYLIAIGVTNYATWSDFVYLENGDSLEILNYVFPDSLESALDKLTATIDLMEMFNDLFGLYPFADEKYGHAQFGYGGGMEHQTMSFMGKFKYSLQAHELAHQWFGDKITCGSWEHIWLNEGFATYVTALTHEYFGRDLDWHNWKSNIIGHVVSQPNGSVWVNDTTSVLRIFHGRLTYNKGATLLHMLRWIMGDENFFEAVRNYLNDPALAFGYALTADLQQHLEDQSGIDLEEFFEDWFYGQGYPSYHVRWMPTHSGIHFDIDQLTSDSSVAFFEMPVPLLVIGEGQEQMLRIDHRFSGQAFEFDLPFEPQEVVLDPDLWLVSAHNIVDHIATATNDIHHLTRTISISPNPATSVLHVDLTALEAEVSSIEIHDAAGKLILVVNPDSDSMDLNIGHLVNGVYHLIFHTDLGVLSRKIVK